MDGSPGDASEGGHYPESATPTSGGKAWLDGSSIDSRWRYHFGNAGDGPAMLDSDGDLAGVTGGAGRCGGGYDTEETAQGEGFDFYSTGGGGGGLFSGGSGGVVNTNRFHSLPIWMAVFGGGGGSGAVVDGEMLGASPSPLPLTSADGEIHLIYPATAVRATSTTTTTTATSTTTTTTTTGPTTTTTTRVSARGAVPPAEAAEPRRGHASYAG